MKKQQLTISIILLLLTSTIQAQRFIEVPADFTTIQEALDDAEEGSIINVAPGIYYENLVWPEDEDGISLIGTDGSENTIIDGSGTDRVLYVKSRRYNGQQPTISSSTLINGFTFRNGYIFDDNGAGIYIVDSALRLIDCSIEGNFGEGDRVLGGGAYMRGFEGEITNCQFNNNIIDSESRAYGTGLYLSIFDQVDISHSTFSGNSGKTNNWCYGGGIYVESYSLSTDISSLNMTNCLVDNNSVSTERWAYGAGIYIDGDDEMEATIDSSIISNNYTNDANWSYGGGMNINVIELKLTNSTLVNNSSREGAAIYSEYISFSSLANTAEISNCNILMNSCSGGVISMDDSPGSLNVTNSIIHHNIGAPFITSSFRDEGPTLNVINSTVAFNSKNIRTFHDFKSTNSIFWNNSDSNDFLSNTTVDPTISNCIVEGGFQGDNIIDSDPLFISEYDLIPRENSPCLSSGVPLSDITTDILGNPRPLPLGSDPDIGAYEIDQYFAHAKTKFYFDENESGLLDGTEKYLNIGSVLHNDKSLYQNFRKEGVFVITPQGMNTLVYDDTTNPDWSPTTETDFAFDVDTDDFVKQIDIGLTPTHAYSDLQPIIESGRFRCGEEVDFSISVHNYGTEIDSGIIWLTLDSRLDQFTFADIPDHTSGSHTVGWDFSDLYPSESITKYFEVTAPLIVDASQVGEIYSFSAYIEDLNKEAPYTYDTELACAYDPNDKNVQPSRSDNQALIEAPMVYKIRFQNTGNDYAKNVVIIDTLDSQLDMESFRVVSSSHGDNLDVTYDENIIRFNFSNIYLPDSLTNEPDSHGHITFSIKAKLDVPIDYIIENTADIIFDFNPPIVTNTTQSIMVEEFLSSTSSLLPILDVNIYPNPTQDQLQISKEVDTAILYDMNGRLIKKVSKTSSMNIRSIEIGSYILELEKDGEVVKKKVIKGEY